MKLVEVEERNLPIAAEIKLVRLQLFMLGKGADGKPLTATPEAAPPIKEDGKKLLRQASRYELLTQRTEQQLADMQQRYRQAQNSMAIFRHLQPSVFTATGEEGKGDKIWLELIEAKAKLGLKRNGPAEQALLQWRIDCYRFATERARRLGENI